MIDVFDLGALGNGVADDSAAIQAACNAPSPSWSLAGLRLGGQVVRFPTPKNEAASANSNEFYRTTEPVYLPANRNIALVGTACQSVVIDREKTKGVPPYAFVVPGGNGAVTFERLTIRHGGIRINGTRAAPVIFRDCIFTCHPEWCISTEDDDVVRNVSIIRCVFTETGPQSHVGWDGGAVRIGSAASRWRIEGSAFLSNAGDAIRLSGSDCVIDRCRFETPRAEHDVDLEHPFNASAIRVVAGSGGGLKVRRCRFGLEAWAPRDMIAVGQKVASMPGYTTPGPQISQSAFRGRTDQDQVLRRAKVDPDDTGRSAIRLAVPARGLQVRDCSVWHYQYLVYSEVADGGLDNAVIDPVFVEGPHVWARGFTKTFADGGRGFEVFGRRVLAEQGRDAPNGRRGTNLVTVDTTVYPAQGSGWTWAELAGFELGDDSPGDVMALTLEPSGKPGMTSQLFAKIDKKHLAALGTGPFVFSLWLRAAGPPVVATLDVSVSADTTPVSGQTVGSRPVWLDATWRRYSAVVSGVRSTDLLAGIRFGTSASGVVIFGPQFEPGAAPTSYAAGLAPPHVQLPGQTLRLGQRALALAKGNATMTGKWSHRSGDRLLEEAPSAGSAMWLSFDGTLWRGTTII